MPIYEYVCGACGHRTDMLHGVNDPGPNFCPECGAEGTMRKAFAPPAIVFRGSGWAKKERRSSSSTSSSGGDGKTDESKPKKADEAAPAKADAGSGGAD
jgi:putative FmdB family regulatory protein